MRSPGSRSRQRGTVVVTDRDGAPLRPAKVWLDQCRASDPPRIGGVSGLAFRALGVRETVAAFGADTELNWIREHEPATFGRIERYLLLSGFAHRLTGRFVDSVGAQVGYLPFDYKRHTWASEGDWKWRIAPFDPAWLPRLVPVADTLGEVTRAASDMTGIPAGLPLVAAAGDKACEVLGSGVLTPGVGAISSARRPQ